MKELKNLVSLIILLIFIGCNENNNPKCPECPEEPKKVVDAAFEANTTEIYQGEKITFRDLSEGEVITSNWSFESGTPNSSTEKKPLITYNEPGLHDVTLEVYSETDTSSLVMEDYILVLDTVTVPCELSFNPQYEVEERTSLVYGIDAVKHRMNVYLPIGDSCNTRPLVIIAGGGGFVNQSDLDKLEPLAMKLAERGMVVANIRYRNVPNNDATNFVKGQSYAVQDISAAVRYFRKEAYKYGINPEQIFTGGFSSGAIGAVIQAYFENADIADPISSLFPSGICGAQGNPGYSCSSIGVISLAGEIYAGLHYIDPDDPHFFGVCSSNDPDIASDSSWTKDRSTPKYGAIAIASYAHTQGLISNYHLFDADNHSFIPTQTDDYFNKLIDFMRNVIEAAEVAHPALAYTESFQDKNPLELGWKKMFIGDQDSSVWVWRNYGNNDFPEANNYDFAPNGADDWLISPEIDLNDYANPKFTFEYALSNEEVAGYGIRCYISNSPLTEELTLDDWTPLSGLYDQQTNATGTLMFLKSDEISLTNHIGDKVRIAFRYTSSGNGTTSAFLAAVDNIIIQDVD